MNAYDYEEEEALPDIEEDWVKDLSRLDELKAQKKLIEDEIAHINDLAAQAQLKGKFVASDGTEFKVDIRRDTLPPKLTNVEAFAAQFPELWGHIATVQVDSTRLKEAVKKGYFTNTPAAAYVSMGTKRPWVQVTPLAKEDTNE